MPTEIKKIAVICTGNVCRSPMGERLLAHALAAEDKPLKDIEVVSAGVSAFPGDAASENSVKALKKVGLDLNDHRSRNLSPEFCDSCDLFIVMTESHKRVIQNLFPDPKKPIYLFREFLNNKDTSVPDPFGSSLSRYEETRDSLVEAIPSIIKFIKSQ